MKKRILSISLAVMLVLSMGLIGCTAEYVPEHSLTISSTEGGSVTNPGEPGPYTYDEGEGVNLVAKAWGGWHFVNWEASAGTFGNSTPAQTTFTMPHQDVTVTASFAKDPYFWTDAYVLLNGPATLPPEERNPCVILYIRTDLVMDSVRVDLPDGRSIIVPRDTGVFSPSITAMLAFSTCVSGMPMAGGEYIFTALDEAGEPIPRVRNTDIWVGVEPPDPPTNVRAELTEYGILVSWDQSTIIPGSFEPATYTQLGFYQLWIDRIETGESVYGVCCISSSPYRVPRYKTYFVPGKDNGLSLSEMEDGTYFLAACVHSVAPEGSLGKGFEYNSSDPSQTIIFTIQDGEITIE